MKVYATPERYEVRQQDNGESAGREWKPRMCASVTCTCERKAEVANLLLFRTFLCLET